MKILLLLMATIFFANDPAEIAKSNKLKKEAQESFKSGDYESAIKSYSFLIDSMQISEDELYLNRAHSYYLLGDTANAKPDYQNATASSSTSLRSLAHQQLGVMAKDKNLLEESLAHLKYALKNDPSNEDARYDYEVVKRLVKEQKDQEQDQENKEDQDKEDQEDQEKSEDQESEENKEDQGDQDKEEQQDEEQQDQEQKNKEGDQEQKEQEGEDKKEGEEEQQGEESEEEGEENQEKPEPTTKEKLKEMNISEEKAQMILEAMQNNEIQYIQQQRRKPTKALDSDKPDW
ncbi:MAG: Ca-activated chloride channel family protein [Cyclobacteriaceae bacterium]|jgi:hypothetical protein